MRSEDGDYENTLRELEDKYLADRLPANLWSGVRKKTTEYNADQVLVKFPFEHSRVADVQKITE